VTCSGEPEVLDGARRELEALAYPRYYLDFETIGPAVPVWAGTRPYANIPVQWSCHIDLSGEPPMRKLAEKLIECLGDEGPVLMYTTFEEGVIRNLIEMFPDLEGPLQAIIQLLPPENARLLVHQGRIADDEPGDGLRPSRRHQGGDGGV
jgi:hypothetical protein